MSDSKELEIGGQKFSVEEVNSKEYQGGSGLPENGMLQTRTQYSTAVQVIRKRDLNEVVRLCEEEAAIAGDEFYYSWSQGGKNIEGLTIGAALAIARNWGNDAVDVKVEKNPKYTIFHGAFIDLQTGFNIVRPFQQNNEIARKKDGSAIYTTERGEDVKFQIGASKAIRNAVLNGVPKWLSNKVMKKAKENIVGKIEKMGKEKAKDMLLKKIEALKIPLEAVENMYSKSVAWDIEKLVMISSAIRAIEAGEETYESAFDYEPVKPETTNVKKDETKEPELKVESAAEVKEDLFATAAELENPFWFIKQIEGMKTKPELEAFSNKYNENFKQFSDKDYQLIFNAIDKKLNQFKKK